MNKFKLFSAGLLSLFFLILISLFPAKVQASCAHTVYKTTCSSTTTNCSVPLGSIKGNNPGYCETTFPGSCYEVVPLPDMGLLVEWTVCYAPKAGPSPKPLDCGTLNKPCCDNQCQEELEPVNIDEHGLLCYCQDPSNPIPTSLPPHPPTALINAPTDPRIGNICVDVQPEKSKTACKICFDAGDTWTALGCIPTSASKGLNAFVAWLLGRLIFVATGIAFILLVVGALQILTSAGNPEKVKAGGELLTSTIAGLLLIILSVFLLKLIGVDILHIPGFGE